MATTSIPHRWNYDGFVSFRGDDIRKSFMDHVFNDFKQKGIHAFRDDRELPKGEKIFSHLYKAIEELRFLIVIFSKDYASWCLRELVKILECKLNESPKHEVRIIFYDAKPDVVRKQKRSYAEAFSKHEISNSTKVGKWKEALSMAADFSRCQDMTNSCSSTISEAICAKTKSTGPTQNAKFGYQEQVPNTEITQVPNTSLPQWPKMMRAGVNKYMKVFMEVDSDRDGKITGY
ncbi:NB-ARC domains-containing protein [Tanacetum coccineum]